MILPYVMFLIRWWFQEVDHIGKFIKELIKSNLELFFLWWNTQFKWKIIENKENGFMTG